MQYLLRVTVLLACLVVLPSAAHARSFSGSRRGSEIVRWSNAALFLWHASQGLPDVARGDDGLTDRERSAFCSLRRSIPNGRGGGFLSTLAQVTSSMLDRDLHSADRFMIALTAPLDCLQTPVPSFSRESPNIVFLPVDAYGFPHSSNPVWNACVRGQGLSIDLIRSNHDTFLHRQGRIRLQIPWTCRDYHRGSLNIWLYPDVPGSQVLLDSRGRFVQIIQGGGL